MANRKGRGQARKSRKALIRMADTLVSMVVRARDRRCVTCGIHEGLTCSHFVKRNVHALRWNLVNCNAQCAPCNSRHNSLSEPYRRYMVSKYGEETLATLESAWSKTSPAKQPELEEMVDFLSGLARLPMLPAVFAEAFDPDPGSRLGIKPKRRA